MKRLSAPWPPASKVPYMTKGTAFLVLLLSLVACMLCGIVQASGEEV